MRVRTSKFVLLVRHFVSGLVDNDLIAPGEDLHASLAGVLGAFLVVSAGAALLFLGKYNSVTFAWVEGRFNPSRLPTFAERLAMALDDKTLLLGGAMCVMALVTVVFWDSLALDARDLAILGPLPVHPATVLLAKAAAVAGAAAVVACALNALPALLFPVVVLAKTPVGLGVVLQSIAAHAVAGVAGCTLVFLAFSALRGVAGMLLSRRAARSVLPLAQFALVLGLLSLLLAMPLLASKTRAAIEAGSSRLVFFPPLWFLGIEEVLIGRGDVVFAGLARVGMTALALAFIGACAVHLCAFLLRSHQVQAGAGSPASLAGRLVSAFVRRLAAVVASDSRAQASFLFSAYTLTRSPRHRLYLAGALGVGLAVSAATVGAAYGGLHLGRQPLDLTSMALAAQLNLIFFLVIGLRMSAAMPADIQAGWVFRLLATPARERHLAGTRAAMFVLVILPLLLLLAPVHAWLWGGTRQPFTSLSVSSRHSGFSRSSSATTPGCPSCRPSRPAGRCSTCASPSTSSATRCSSISRRGWSDRR